ncbi:MAG: D-alanyl-D-alanine carboxypeptidase family protein [Methylovirgula sp.]
MDGSHPRRSPSHPSRIWLQLCGIVFVTLGFIGSAAASPAIVIDVATGNVLYQEQANEPWYPASLTKLMTIYVALSAVRDRELSLDTPLVVSARAASMAPSKMGFAPGTEVTLNNALKMLVVKSANDVAVTVAEGIAGSVEAFADDMNHAAAQLGMTETHFANPNGLQNPDHFSSARDLAILARALLIQFPQTAALFDIGALRLGDEIIPTHNDILGRYPGADGMKTGFTCSSGFNLIASATRGGHHYISVVLGAPSVKARLIRTAVLLDRAFAGIDHPHPMLAAEKVDARPPDMHNVVCRHRAKALIAWAAETERLEAPLSRSTTPTLSANGFLFNAAPAADRAPMASRIALMRAPVFEPVAVYVGPAPGYLGPVAEARPPHSPIGTPPEIVSTEPTRKAPSVATGDAAKPAAVAASTSRTLAKKKAKKTASKRSRRRHLASKAKRHRLAKAHASKFAKGKTGKTAKRGGGKFAGKGKSRIAGRPAKLAAKPKPASSQD